MTRLTPSLLSRSRQLLLNNERLPILNPLRPLSGVTSSYRSSSRVFAVSDFSGLISYFVGFLTRLRLRCTENTNNSLGHYFFPISVMVQGQGIIENIFHYYFFFYKSSVL